MVNPNFMHIVCITRVRAKTNNWTMKQIVEETRLKIFKKINLTIFLDSEWSEKVL